MQENFKAEFKPVIENMQEKLHQGKHKQSKDAKICASIRWELEYEKCSKTFCKIFARQNMQNQTNTKRFSNPEEIFKSAKNFLEKRNPKEDSSKTTISQVLSKNSKRRKTSKQHYNFTEAKISLEVHGMQWEAKFLRGRKFEGNNTTFVRQIFLQKFMVCS